jgi:hypothetical protein
MAKEPKVPVFVAVGFWFASALAVATYTYTAYKETAGGQESGAWNGGQGNPLVASKGVLQSELTPVPSNAQLKGMLTPVPGGNLQPAFKPLERGKFKGSK